MAMPMINLGATRIPNALDQMYKKEQIRQMQLRNRAEDPDSFENIKNSLLKGISTYMDKREKKKGEAGQTSTWQELLKPQDQRDQDVLGKNARYMPAAIQTLMAKQYEQQPIGSETWSAAGKNVNASPELLQAAQSLPPDDRNRWLSNALRPQTTRKASEPMKATLGNFNKSIDKILENATDSEVIGEVTDFANKRLIDYLKQGDKSLDATAKATSDTRKRLMFDTELKDISPPALYGKEGVMIEGRKSVRKMIKSGIVTPNEAETALLGNGWNPQEAEVMIGLKITRAIYETLMNMVGNSTDRANKLAKRLGYNTEVQ